MLQARLATRFVEQASMADVPQGPRQHLESALRLAERQRHEVLWEVDCVRRALAGVDTPVVLLKGAAYLAADLPPARGRLFADVDIMVDRRQLVAVENALFAAGWISQERNAYNDRYYRRWMHELPPMRHVHRGTTIDLHHTITPEDAGTELRSLAREENPAAILKSWEEHDLLETVHPALAKKHLDFDSVNRLSKVRDDLFMAGLRPRLATPMMLAILGRLKDREQGSLLHKLGFRAAEVDHILSFEEEAHAAGKELAGKKLAAPIDAYRFLEKMRTDVLAHLLALRNRWGDAAWVAWCRALQANRPFLVDGNSVVVQFVARGSELYSAPET